MMLRLPLRHRPTLYHGIRSAIQPARQTTSRGWLHASGPVLKQMPPRPKPPPEDEIEESFLKGSGPGGQKINKTNSAVQLKHLPTGLVVKSQATRSREQNRTIARALLARKLDDLAHGERSRSAIVTEAARKKKASKSKKSRRKYRALEGPKEREADGEADAMDARDGGTDGRPARSSDGHEEKRGPTDERYEEKDDGEGKEVEKPPNPSREVSSQL